MAQSIGSLVVSLGLDAAEYTRGLEKSKRDAERASADMVRAFERAGAMIGAAGGVAALGLAAIVKSSIDAADHLNDLSKATGLTVETLGGIGFAAGQAGGDLDSAAAAIGKLNLSIAKAAAGDKEAGEAFAKMGISVRDAAGNTKAADAVFTEVASKFAGYAEGPEQAALANALFGKSYQGVLPLLKDGGQALQDNIAYYQRFGGVSTETARQADEFNDTLGKIALVAGSAGRTLTADLLPPLNAVAQYLLKGAEEASGFSIILEGIKAVFQTVAVVGANVAFVFGGVGRELGALAAQATALATLDFKGFTAIGDAVKEDGRRARAELDLLEQQILGLTPKITTADLARRGRLPATGGTTPAPAIGGGPTKPGTPAGPKGDPALTEAERYLQALQRQVDKTQELSAVEQARLDITRGMKGITDQLADEIIDKAAAVDASKRLQSQYAAEAEQEKALRAEQEAQQSRAKALYEATRTPVEQLQRSLVEYNALLAAGAISWDTYSRAVFDAQDAFDKTVPKVEEVIQEMDRFREQAAKNVQDAIGDNLVKAMEGNFQSIADGFKNLVKRMVAEALAAKITKALFPDVAATGGGASGGFSWLGLAQTLFGAASGSSAGTVSGGTGIKVSGSVGAGSSGRMAVQSVNIESVGAGVSRGEMQVAIGKALAANNSQTARARVEGRA